MRPWSATRSPIPGDAADRRRRDVALNDGTTITGGTLSIGSSGELDIETGANGPSYPDATLDDVSVSNSGTMYVGATTPGAILTLDDGTTITGGALSIGSSGALDIETGANGPSYPDATLDDVSVSNSGTVYVGATTPGAILTLDDGTTITGGALSIGSSGALDIETGADGPSYPDATLDDVSVSNSGTVYVGATTPGAILTLDDGTTIAGGALSIGSSGALDIETGADGPSYPDATLDDVSVSNSGTVYVGATTLGAILTLDDGTTITGGALSIGSSGALDIETGADGPSYPDATLDDVSVSNSGTVYVGATTPGAILTLDDGTTITGGALSIGSSGRSTSRPAPTVPAIPTPRSTASV